MTETRDEKIALAVHLLRASRHAVAFTGAGVSTPSGIPDFRSPDSGLWSDVDPMEVASIFGFRQNPKKFFDWILPLARTTFNAQPNPAHCALAEMEAQGIIKAVITQNIDMLHTRAGNKMVYELHGHMREATCTHCFRIYDGGPVLAKFLDDGALPLCPACNGILKPNVILFGEQLPYREIQGARAASKQSDVMVIAGSSLEVAPASDLPRLTLANGGSLIVINLQPTHLDAAARVVIRDDVASVLPVIAQQLANL